MFLGSDPELEIVGEARDGAEAVRLALQLHPDVVLMDLLMPVMDGIRATAAIRRQAPDTEVVALTSVLEDALSGRCGASRGDRLSAQRHGITRTASGHQGCGIRSGAVVPAGSRPTDERGAHAGADQRAADRA